MIDTAGIGRSARGTVTEPVSESSEGPVGVSGSEPATAVTTADAAVVSVVWTVPFVSVFTFDGVRFPVVVVNATGMALRGLPAASVTTAVTVILPPSNGTDDGLAVSAIRPTAAVPTTRFMGLARTPPELALMTAVPDPSPAEKTAVA
jgi:hypothetical protein